MFGAASDYYPKYLPIPSLLPCRNSLSYFNSSFLIHPQYLDIASIQCSFCPPRRARRHYLPPGSSDDTTYWQHFPWIIETQHLKELARSETQSANYVARSISTPVRPCFYPSCLSLLLFFPHVNTPTGPFPPAAKSIKPDIQLLRRQT